MNGCCRLWRIPNALSHQDLPIRYRLYAVIVPHILPFRRVTEGAAEIAFRYVSRYVRRRMNGNTHMPDQ